MVFGAFGGIIRIVVTILNQSWGAQTLLSHGVGFHEALRVHPLVAGTPDLGHTLRRKGTNLMVYRIQHLGGPAFRSCSRQLHAQFRFSPSGNPAAATHAHRMAANGFNIGSPPASAVSGAACDDHLHVLAPGLLRSVQLSWVSLFCISLVLRIYLDHCFRLRLKCMV